VNIVDNDKKVDQIQFFGLKLEDATSVSIYSWSAAKLSMRMLR
jgi:hypothetical protein